MEWVTSTLHTTLEHGVSSFNTADAHTTAASSRLNWRLRRFKWTPPFRRKTKSGFCACAITFQLASTTNRHVIAQGSGILIHFSAEAWNRARLLAVAYTTVYLQPNVLAVACTTVYLQSNVLAVDCTTVYLQPNVLAVACTTVYLQPNVLAVACTTVYLQSNVLAVACTTVYLQPNVLAVACTTVYLQSNVPCMTTEVKQLIDLLIDWRRSFVTQN
jgi:hypothetical protein